MTELIRSLDGYFLKIHQFRLLNVSRISCSCDFFFFFLLKVRYTDAISLITEGNAAYFHRKKKKVQKTNIENGKTLTKDT